MGEYREKLKQGGELIVTARKWHITYYFEGPDLRYNGTFFTINEEEIDKYITAWKKNFQEYLSIKENFHLSGNFEKIGDMGMVIRIGMLEGVSLVSYHLCIKQQKELDLLLDEYMLVKTRAKIIQKALKELL